MNNQKLVSFFYSFAIIFSFLLAVPEIHHPYATDTQLSKTIKVEISHLAFKPLPTLKAPSGKKFKDSKSQATVIKDMAPQPGKSPHDQYFPEGLSRLKAASLMPLLARAPPQE